MPNPNVVVSDGGDTPVRLAEPTTTGSRSWLAGCRLRVSEPPPAVPGDLLRRRKGVVPQMAAARAAAPIRGKLPASLAPPPRRRIARDVGQETVAEARHAA